MEVSVDRCLHRRPRFRREAGRTNHLLLGRHVSAVTLFCRVSRMKLTGPKVLALTLLVTAGHLVVPSLGGGVPASTQRVHQRLVAVPGSRACPARRHPADRGCVRVHARCPTRWCGCRWPGAAGVPANALAAVLNVTGVNTTAPGYVTVYPAGTDAADGLQRQLRPSRPGDGQHGHRQARRRRRCRRLHAESRWMSSSTCRVRTCR